MLGYGTKIIILLFWFRAGDGRAEYPFPSASTLPMHAQSARAAVRAPGAVQFALGEQGRRSRGPCGTRCPALAASVAHCALSGAASYFFLVSKASNSCNHFFRSRNKTKTGPDSLVLTSRPPSDAERRGHPIVVVQCNSSLLSRGRSCGQYVEASHRRNTSLTLLVSNRIRGTTRPRTGQWRPPL